MKLIGCQFLKFWKELTSLKILQQPRMYLIKLKKQRHLFDIQPEEYHWLHLMFLVWVELYCFDKPSYNICLLFLKRLYQFHYLH